MKNFLLVILAFFTFGCAYDGKPTTLHPIEDTLFAVWKCFYDFKIDGNAIRKNGYSKRSKTRQIIGIDYDCFLQHLIQTAIKNYGVYDSSISYHIDHIYPCSLAKDEAELLRLQHYTNLQFLLPSDNISKSNKVVNDFNCTR